MGNIHVYNVCKRFVYFTLFLNEMIKCVLHISRLEGYTNAYYLCHKVLIKIGRDGTRIELPCMYKYTYSTVVNECQFRIKKIKKSKLNLSNILCGPSLNVENLMWPSSQKVCPPLV